MPDRLTALSFDGVNLKTTYNMYVGRPTVSSPQRDVEELVVAGRNGVLTIDNGRFKEVERIYPYVIKGTQGITGARKFFLQHQIGEYSIGDTANEGQRTIYGRFDGVFEPRKSPTGDLAVGEIRFVCRPEKYTVNAFVYSTLSHSDNTVNNSTGNVAKPLFKIDFAAGQTGSVTIVTNLEQAIRVGWSGSTAKTVYVDCEMQEAYFDDNTSANSLLSFSSTYKPEFPVLVAGTNTVKVLAVGVAGAVVKMQPRWYEL